MSLPECIVADPIVEFEGMKIAQSSIGRIKSVRERVAELRNCMADRSKFNSVADLIRFRGVIDRQIAALQTDTESPIEFKRAVLIPSDVDSIPSVRARAVDLHGRLDDPTVFNSIEDLVRFRDAVDLQIAALESASKKLP
jgi:hypothetical protein